MLQFPLRRLLPLIPVVIGASIVIFLLVHLSPGDPIRMMLGEDAEPEQVRQLNELYGFDQPLPVQYLRWAGRALTGDFGTSIRQRAPVTELVRSEEHTSELQSRGHLVCRLLLEKKKTTRSSSQHEA